MRPLLPVLLAGALAVAGAACAQPPAQDGATRPSREAMRQDWAARRQAHEAREVADMTTVLRLRPDQQAGLRAWLEAGRGDRRGRMSDGPKGEQAPLTTAQNLDRESARMTERETHERARLDATRRFYGSLSPEQQGAFDALERLRHGHGGRHGGPGMMRMGERRGGTDGLEGPPGPRAGE